MAPKRPTSRSNKGALVPIGELIPKVYRLTPKHRSLLDVALSIADKDAAEANALGFSTRVLVQASLPHRDPGPDHEFWIRTNGNLSLVIRQGIAVQDGKVEKLGFPFGNIPRLILAYICTQAITQKTPEIELGRSLAAFMEAIGLNRSGGERGDIGRLKNQLNRLVEADISFQVHAEGIDASSKRPIASDKVFWWDAKNPEQETLFKSYIRLDHSFYEEIMAHPVPLDMRAVQVLRQSSLALDLYTWLTHRVSYLEKPVRIPWVALEKQVGSEYGTTKNFKQAAKEALQSIQALWPDLKLDDATGGFILKPSRPHVAPKTSILLPPGFTKPE